MYSLDYTTKFKRDLRRCRKRGYDIAKITEVIAILEECGSLPLKYHPHRLSGNRNGQWECHIQPDWLMVWEQNDMELTLLFTETGTHSDLFH